MSTATQKQLDFLLTLAQRAFPDVPRSTAHLSSFRAELGLTQREARGDLTKARASTLISELLAKLG